MLQQSIKTILSVSAYLSASAASLVQGRWIYHKSTDPIGDWAILAAQGCLESVWKVGSGLTADVRHTLSYVPIGGGGAGAGGGAGGAPVQVG